MTTIHFEDAVNFLIAKLTELPEPGPGQAQARQQRAHGADIWLELASAEYWSSRGKPLMNLSQDELEPLIAPFYDAAWALCRRGILRPGAAVAAGHTGSQIGLRFAAAPFYGDGFPLPPGVAPG